MTLGGWITMSLSVGFAVTLFAWCIFKVLTTRDGAERIHGLEDIDRGED